MNMCNRVACTRSSILLILIVSVFALYPGGSAYSDQEVQTEIGRIDAYCKDLDNYVGRNLNYKIVLANTASGFKESGDSWREFANEEEIERLDNGDNLNENANVWLRSGSIVFCSFMFQSPSRDWANYVDYYFRTDGTLVKVHSTLNTFYGNIRRVRDSYYSSRGELLKDTVEYVDLNTGFKKKPDENFFDEQIPLYKTVANLPVYKLLNKARK